MKLHADTLHPGALSPHKIDILLETILKNNNFFFMYRHSLELVVTAMGTKVAPPYANLFMGHNKETIREAFVWAILLLEEFRDHILPDLPQQYQPVPIPTGLHEPPPPHNQVHFSTLHPTDILPRNKDPH